MTRHATCLHCGEELTKAAQIVAGYCDQSCFDAYGPDRREYDAACERWARVVLTGTPAERLALLDNDRLAMAEARRAARRRVNR